MNNTWQFHSNNGEQLPELRITRYIPYLPTSVFFANEDFSIVDGYILNPGKDVQKVFIDVSIEGIEDIIKVDALPIPPGKSVLPRIRMPRFAQQDFEKLRHTVQISVATMEMFLPGGERSDRKSWEIWLSQPDLALIAQCDQQGRIKDYSSMLAWWVNSGAKGVENLLNRILPLDKRLHLGYPASLSDKQETTQIKYVNQQVQALFEGLKEINLKYLPTKQPWIAEDNMILQRIRSPERILEDKDLPINCLDGAVLFASLLEYIGIEPIIVLAQKHALVGWKYRPLTVGIENLQQIFQICNFLDPTVLTTEKDFYSAISAAQGHWKLLIANIGSRDKSLSNFMSIVDVKAERGKPPSGIIASVEDTPNREILKYQNTSKDVEKLTLIISDEKEKEKERLIAVRRLQAIATPMAIATLSSVAQKNDSLNVRAIAIQALGKVGGGGMIDVLKRTIQDQSDEIRAASVRALSEIEGCEIGAILKDLLYDPAISVQVEAIRALGTINAIEFQGELLHALDSDNEEIVEAANVALSRLGQ